MRWLFKFSKRNCRLQKRAQEKKRASVCAINLGALLDFDSLAPAALQLKDSQWESIYNVMDDGVVFTLLLHSLFWAFTESNSDQFRPVIEQRHSSWLHQTADTTNGSQWSLLLWSYCGYCSFDNWTPRLLEHVGCSGKKLMYEVSYSLLSWYIGSEWRTVY